jgi:hypothetical protein
MTGTASRRRVLAGTAAALIAPAAVPNAAASLADEAEARLVALRLAARPAFDAHEAAVILFNRADEAGDAAAAAQLDEQVEAAWDAREAVLLAMAEIPASSLVGLAAKADFAHAVASVGASDAELELLRSLAADTARVLGDRAPPSAAACPDAELVAACDAYAEAMQRFNDEGGHLEPEVCPLWRAVDAARDRALAAPPPRSLAGIRAKAELCRTMALRAPDGRRDYSDSYCGTWPGQVVEDVLRLVVPGGAGST